MRKASVTLGFIYCIWDEGNGLSYSILLCNLWECCPLGWLSGCWRDLDRLGHIYKEGEELGHKGSEHPAVDVNWTIGQGL